MIYRRFEFSQSLNGNKIFHIARNAAGIVVFREKTEKKLKLAIDKHYDELNRKARLAAKQQAAKAKKNGKLFNKGQPNKKEPARKKRFWG